MKWTKQFKTHTELVELLHARGMKVGDLAHAEALLEQLSYYRLSGYWYPLRRFEPPNGTAQDHFVEGASLDLVVDLYRFDERLRHCVFIELDRVELTIRAKLGHELGRLDPLIHMKPQCLSACVNKPCKGSTAYEVWLEKHQRALKSSKEDFADHHKSKYGGVLPIWVAVEIMDWGMLSHLYGMSPHIVRTRIAEQCSLRAPQLESWLKSLNIVRNYVAHHARMFNRVYDIKPKLNNDPRLCAIAGKMNRAFGQLSLIQYLYRQLNLSPADRLPRLFETYPHNPIVPLLRTGAPEGWEELELWSY